MKHFCSFSEAIREGAKLTAQAFGYGVSPDGTATCAWGAGVHAITGSLADEDFLNCRPLTLFPYLRREVECPDCDYLAAMFETIYHLNDYHKWGRSAIADWLESEEKKLGFVTVVESETPRADLSFDQKPESARAGVLN